MSTVQAMQNGQGKSILLVDDEDRFLDVLSNRLARRAFRVVKARSGTQALQALRKADFDAVVLDLKMEDIDGIDLLKILKRMVPDLPVIILTGHGSDTAAREGMALGAFDWLTKPCAIEELMEKLSQAFGPGFNPDEKRLNR